MDRREFVRAAGAAASVAMAGGLNACDGVGEFGSGRDATAAGSAPGVGSGRWAAVRSRFAIGDDPVQLSGMLLAPHPDTVRAAIHEHRIGLDTDPTRYVEANDGTFKRRSREAAASYMGVDRSDVGLTDSTTMGIGLTYGGIRLRAGQEIVLTDHEYRATHEAIELRAERDGVVIRQANLGPDVRILSAGQIVDRIMSEVTDSTRALAMTWVHSSTGLKLPVRAIADRLDEHNGGRSPEERAILCLDGVHGFGVEDADIPELGCDIFFAGTHKWIFAPRGTGVIWGRTEVQAQFDPSIPTFMRDGTWGGRMSPGGFKAFEHQWSMAEAFEFHDEIGGRSEVRDRIHALAGQLREELDRLDGVELRTPLDAELSSGIVAFDIDGLTASDAVSRFADRGIVASAGPYALSHTRFSPGLLNTEAEIDRALTVTRDLAG